MSSGDQNERVWSGGDKLSSGRESVRVAGLKRPERSLIHSSLVDSTTLG